MDPKAAAVAPAAGAAGAPKPKKKVAAKTAPKDPNKKRPLRLGKKDRAAAKTAAATKARVDAAAAKAAAKVSAKAKQRKSKLLKYRLPQGGYRWVKKTYGRPVKSPTKVKKIGGEKNGGTREILRKKRPAYYPTTDTIQGRPRMKSRPFCTGKPRKSLTPGTVCILVAGRYKGRRVVLLKVLSSGLLLVNGPFTLNGVPLRRVHQNYVIATSTKIDISTMRIPPRINDEYFRRIKRKPKKVGEGEIFARKTERYVPSEERKVDQKKVDKRLIVAIKNHPEKTFMFKYLCRLFGFKNTEYPHRMKF